MAILESLESVRMRYLFLSRFEFAQFALLRYPPPRIFSVILTGAVVRTAIEPACPSNVAAEPWC
jgi:hypothetical protein